MSDFQLFLPEKSSNLVIERVCKSDGIINYYNNGRIELTSKDGKTILEEGWVDDHDIEYIRLELGKLLIKQEQLLRDSIFIKDQLQEDILID